MSAFHASAAVAGAFLFAAGVMVTKQQESPPSVRLPALRRDGAVSLDSALRARRSVREFTREAVTLAEAGQLLWAAQGITRGGAGRTVPSAGALYPMEVYLVAGRVRDLPVGVYRYDPQEHRLALVHPGDARRELAAAAARQSWIEDAAAVIVLAAVYQRTTGKYGERGRRYVHIEVGHAAQNVYLEAAALGLGTTMVGAFDDARVARSLGIAGQAEPLGLLPVGRPR